MKDNCNKTNYKEEISELSNLPINSYCFDCNESNPEWASVTNGLFLCITCAGLHRNLGLGISKIKSISLDSWNHEEYLIMKNSGNKRFKEFLDKYGIGQHEAIDVKYRYKIVQYYRDLIKAEVLQTNFPTELSKDEEKDIIKTNFKSEEQINKINNEHIITNCAFPPKKQKKKGFLNDVKSFFKKGVKEIKSKTGKMFTQKENKGINNNNENIKIDKYTYQSNTNHSSPSGSPKNHNDHINNSSPNYYSPKEYKVLTENNNLAYQNQFGGNVLTQNQMNVHLYLAECKTNKMKNQNK